MPQIFELFGYPLADSSSAAIKSRKEAWCPFMDEQCDGGGNRYLSSVDTNKNSALATFFTVQGVVQAGICSLSIRDDSRPWIVCPHRLLTLRNDLATRKYQSAVEDRVINLSGFDHGTRIGIWSEVKIKSRTSEESGGVFDYTFDYVLVPLRSTPGREVADMVGTTWQKLSRAVVAAGYQLAMRNDQDYIENCPSGSPVIIEIMTSSTSGGNKADRSQIPMAFSDAILGKPHKAPGVNYRQVWARMVSQLIVKSEVALKWGGRAFWILQDVLADYISDSTALDLRKFLALHPSEVNMLCLGYDSGLLPDAGPISLTAGTLYAGPISSGDAPIGSCFQDIIRAPSCPKINALLSVLLRKPMRQTIVIP